MSSEKLYRPFFSKILKHVCMYAYCTNLALPSIGPRSCWISAAVYFFCLNFGGPLRLSMAPKTSGSEQSPSNTNLAELVLQLGFHLDEEMSETSLRGLKEICSVLVMVLLYVLGTWYLPPSIFEYPAR